MGERPFYRSCDIRDILELQQVMTDFAHAGCQPISVLVNNAARDDRVHLQALEPNQWDEAANTNLKPYIFTAQAVIEGMTENGGGSIINMSSNAPNLGIAGFPAYAATKSAISGMTKSLAQELGDKGIRVNSILPGWCLTERQKRLWYSEEAMERTLERQAIKRGLTGIDLANAALFLASDASAMVTGTSMFVDGGIC